MTEYICQSRKIDFYTFLESQPKIYTSQKPNKPKEKPKGWLEHFQETNERIAQAQIVEAEAAVLVAKAVSTIVPAGCGDEVGAHYSGKDDAGWGDSVSATRSTDGEVDPDQKILLKKDSTKDSTKNDIINQPTKNCGNPVWIRAATSAISSADDITLDKKGNIYVTGTKCNPSGTICNVWTEKLDPNGAIIWTTISSRKGVGRAIKVDSNGNTYVIGETETNQMFWDDASDILITKFDPSGKILFEKIYDGPADRTDWGEDIEIKNGYLYSIGTINSPGNGQSSTKDNSDAWFAKYDLNGNNVWMKTFNGKSGLSDFGNGIAIDGTGNIITTGFTEVESPSRNYDIWIGKYDQNNGTNIFTKNINGKGNLDDYGSDVVADKNNNLYVCGSVNNNVAATKQYWMDNDAWTSKFDPKGNLIWTQIYNGSFNGGDGAGRITLDKDQNPYIIGGTSVPGAYKTGHSDILIKKYNSAGQDLLTQTYNSFPNSNEVGTGIVVDSSHTVYASGSLGYPNGYAAYYNSYWIGKYVDCP